jgi:CRISPR system Cascade subunit CasE
MHLSRLTLNPRSRAVRRDTSNPYFMHQTLARVTSGDGLTLWRLEDTILLVQSQERPDWGQLEPGYLARASESKPLDVASIVALERPLRFRLRANPKKSESKPKAERGTRKESGRPTSGKRTGLYELEDQVGWLNARALANGFELLDFMVTHSDRWKFRKDSESISITLAVAEFDGHLRITDPERFRTTLEQGLGRGKALGLGLFSVGPSR